MYLIGLVLHCTEIRGLRKENVALNDQIGEMNAEYADLKEQIEGMKLEEEREKEEVGVQTEEKDSLLHADCHKTVEALHYEISSLQNRLHAQDAQHSEESIQIKGLLREMDGLKREAVDLLMVTEEVSHLHDGHGGKDLVKDHVKEMHAIYHKSMLTAQVIMRNRSWPGGRKHLFSVLYENVHGAHDEPGQHGRGLAFC